MQSKSWIGRRGWVLAGALLTVLASPGFAQLVVEDIPAGELPLGVTFGRRLVTPNLRVAAILNRLDIDGDGQPDNSPDTDGDGLPDNWEVGGFEAPSVGGAIVDRVVFYPSPSPIVPGTPPTPIFTRLAISTSASNPDTDRDGISDFIEVFGLLFIDENANGILDANEWNDKNGDGLPSPGEFPLDNADVALNLLHDFDGFIFTDPTNDDTDGDGRSDAVDNDPLINPRAFGNADQFIVKQNLQGDEDFDNDGLGNGMDLGNDLVAGDPGVTTTFQLIDNPENIRDLLNLFRPDLLAGGVIPEAQIEDLLGADWDSNGLWRTTDVREWSIVIDRADRVNLPPDEFFRIDDHDLYADQTFAELAALYNDPAYNRYGDRGVGLGWQELLEPSGLSNFLPDVHVWAILYAWRMPGFDIDGDGFIGVPNLSSTVDRSDQRNVATVALQNGRLVDTVLANSTAATDAAFDDYITLPADTGADAADEQRQQAVFNEPELNGHIGAPEGFPTLPCGTAGWLPLAFLAFGLVALRSRR